VKINAHFESAAPELSIKVLLTLLDPLFVMFIFAPGAPMAA
jgi:hypothetical protein